jgi:hypothetical protein
VSVTAYPKKVTCKGCQTRFHPGAEALDQIALDAIGIKEPVIYAIEQPDDPMFDQQIDVKQVVSQITPIQRKVHRSSLSQIFFPNTKGFWCYLIFICGPLVILGLSSALDQVRGELPPEQKDVWVAFFVLFVIAMKLYHLIRLVHGKATACPHCKVYFSAVLVDEKTEKIDSRIEAYTYNDPIKVRNNSGDVVFNIDNHKTGFRTVNTYHRNKKFRCKCCPQNWETDQTWNSCW